MHAVVGIYQSKEEMDNQLRTRGFRGRRICQVGPFTSSSQALEWMAFMEQRLRPRSVKRLVVGQPNPKDWYGISLTLEQGAR